MYTAEEKRRAVELFIQYDKSCMAVINELGYPCRQTLYDWHEEYVRSGKVERRSMERYTDEQKAKIGACKTPEDVLALAKEEGYELTEDELEMVTGGGGRLVWECCDRVGNGYWKEDD